MYIKKILTAKNITLRPYQKEDMAFWNTWDTDKDTQMYMPEPENEIQSNEQMSEYFQECESDLEGIYATIVLTKTDTPIGTICLTDINEYHQIADFGILLGEKKEWGKGYGSETVSLFLKYIKENTNLYKITAEIEEGNLGIERVLIKNGFVFEALHTESRIKNKKRINTKKYVYFLDK